MKKIISLIDKAQKLEHPPLSKIEQYERDNEYIGLSRDELFDLMGKPTTLEQNRKIIFALVWGCNSGG